MYVCVPLYPITSAQWMLLRRRQPLRQGTWLYSRRQKFPVERRGARTVGRSGLEWPENKGVSFLLKHPFSRPSAT